MRIVSTRIIFSFLLLLITLLGKAEYDYIFEHLSTKDGLSHGSVSAMLKDRQGFMWFATWDGINRFDGYSFKAFKPFDGSNPSFSSNRIESMKEDSLGNIWVTTYDLKLFRFDRFSESFSAIPNDSIYPDLTINGFFPLSSGDVWIATSKGAFRVMTDSISNYFSVENYNENRELPLPGNEVWFISEGLGRTIWVNTDKGLTCFERRNNLRELKSRVLSESNRSIFNRFQITVIYNSKTLSYFGTKEGELLVYNNSTDELRAVGLGNHSAISCITGTSKGKLFIGTSDSGIIEYDEWTAKKTNHYLNQYIKKILRLFIDTKGLLWIESSEAGISKIDPRNESIRHYEQALGVNQDIRGTSQCGFLEDEDGKLWLTLKGGGFGYYNAKTDEIDYFFNNPFDPKSRISNFVNCFYKDQGGVLWLSTYFKGVEKITFIDNKFHHTQLAPEANLSIANEVRAMLEDSKGFLWIATKNQELFILDNKFSIIKKIDSFNGERIGTVYAIMEDADGDIFVGTKGNGLFRLKRNGDFRFDVNHYTHDPNDDYSLSSNNVYSLLEDRQGRIWVGTYGGGVNLFVNGQFYHSGNKLENYPTEKGNRVRHIAEDSKGNIWIGTTNGILFADPEGASISQYNFRHFSKELGNVKGLLSNDIFWIFIDDEESVWVASLGGGLARVKQYPLGEKPLEFSVLTKNDGLSSDVLFTITADRKGNLWMSTENGISSYNPKENIFRNFGQYDGTLSSGFSEAAIAVRSDGKICFGTNNGLYSFQPDEFNYQQRKANIVFTGFKLFGKEISPSKEGTLKRSITEKEQVTLRYNQNVFTIAWAGLDYKMQGKLRYDYFLEGFDNDWIYANTQHQASYTKLPPGKYRFKVQFSNAELQRLNDPKTITIEIKPPFWRTTWAYIIFLLTTILLAEVARRIIFNMIRLRNKVAIERELTDIKLNFFTNISHELRTPLTLITGPAKELKEKENLSEKGQNYIALIEHNANRLLRLVNQLLDFRKIENDKMELVLNATDLVRFVKMVCHNFDELSNEKNISLSIRSNIDKLLVTIDEEKMEGVFFNLLSNAFKFTPQGGSIDVWINLLTDENAVTIAVSDSGPGISTEHEDSLFTIFSSQKVPGGETVQGTGIGLALSKKLVLLHGGKLSHQPSQNGGASFTVKLPINSEEISTNSDETAMPATANMKVNHNSNFPKVLIVEDDHDLRNFIKSQLENEFIIVEAEDGQAGLEKAGTHQPDLILSDIMMPVMSGIELLDHVKNNFETSHIPVVLLSARSSVESKIEGLKYGADAYLTKPFSIEQLKEQLKNLLYQRLILRKYFVRQQSSLTEHEVLAITSPDFDFLSQVKEIVQSNLSNSDFRIETIYKQLGMGRSKFFDKLKGLTGLSPIDFVTEYRLNKACELLQSNKYNISEVSYLTGFSDSSYFSKCFKEHIGMSPSQFLKKSSFINQ